MQATISLLFDAGVSGTNKIEINGSKSLYLIQQPWN